MFENTQFDKLVSIWIVELRLAKAIELMFPPDLWQNDHVASWDAQLKQR